MQRTSATPTCVELHGETEIGHGRPRSRGLPTHARAPPSSALRRRLTQVEVAKALDIPQQHVSRIETADRRIDPLELAQLAKLYDKELMYFLS